MLSGLANQFRALRTYRMLHRKDSNGGYGKKESPLTQRGKGLDQK